MTHDRQGACDLSHLSLLSVTSIDLSLLWSYRWSMYCRKDAHSKLVFFKNNVIRQGHNNKPVKSAGSCVDLDQSNSLETY